MLIADESYRLYHFQHSQAPRIRPPDVGEGRLVLAISIRSRSSKRFSHGMSDGLIGRNTALVQTTVSSICRYNAIENADESKSAHPERLSQIQSSLQNRNGGAKRRRRFITVTVEGPRRLLVHPLRCRRDHGSIDRAMVVILIQYSQDLNSARDVERRIILRDVCVGCRTAAGVRPVDSDIPRLRSC